LLTAYMQTDDRANARRIADRLLANDKACPMCLVNVANLALADGDTGRASIALDRARQGIAATGNLRIAQAFIVSTGRLAELTGDVQGAEEAYRDAAKLEPFDPQARMNLALMLARQGRGTQAQEEFAAALSLFAVDEREVRRREFEQAMRATSHDGK